MGVRSSHTPSKEIKMTKNEELFITALKAAEASSAYKSIPKELTHEEYIDSLRQMFEAHDLEYEVMENHIVIKLKDTVCRDSYGNTTPIYEPWIRITVDRYTRFRRTKYTHLQYETGYAHSHVSGNARDWTSGICYGPNQVMGRTFHETLEMMLCFYPVFLSQESTMTRPYKRLAELALGRGEKTQPSSIDLKLFTKCVRVKIKSLLGLQQLIVELIDEVEMDRLLTERDITVYKIDNKYYASLNRSSLDNRGLDTDFIFKGKKQKIQIVKDENIPQKVPCPITKKHIIDSYTSIINEPKFYSESTSNLDNK